MRVLIVVVMLLAANWAYSEALPEFILKLEVPELSVDPYYKPYVAVWVETEDRQPVAILALWYMLETNASQEDGTKWLKDLRQWWRKIGRDKTLAYDAVSGATRRPGTYQLSWSPTAEMLNKTETTRWVLHVEASREEGGRSYQRLPIDWPNFKDQSVKRETTC